MSFKNDDDFDSSTYVSVAERLKEFWEKHPQGRIETEASPMGSEGVVVRAALFKDVKDEKPSATGHAFLESIYGDKVGEYTETVAVGRALALMGFKVEKGISSGEEMKRWKKKQEEKQEAQSDEPKEEPKLKAASKFNIGKLKGKE